MTDEPAAPPLPRVQSAASNALGITGFGVSLGGLLCTAGTLCPVGLILSLVALRKEPRGLAIAGSIIGLFGTIVAVIWIVVAMGFAGGKKAFEEGGGSFSTVFVMVAAVSAVEMDRDEKGRLPDSAAGNTLIAELRDGWNRALRYEVNGESFTIRSAGQDGEFDTLDDITQEK